MRISILISLLFLVIDVSGYWPEFRGNPSRTGAFFSQKHWPSKDPSWKVTLGGAVLSSPSIDSGIVYVGSHDSCVYALESRTGSILWKTKLGDWVDAAPMVYRSKVIISCRDSTVYVIDKSTGTIIHRIHAGIQIGSPAVSSNGDLLIAMGPPLAYILVCTFTDSSWNTIESQSIIELSSSTYSSPAISNNRLVIGANDGLLRCYDLSTQELIWSLQTNISAYVNTPAIKNGIVYYAASDFDNATWAIDLSDGQIRWQNSDIVPLQKHLSPARSSSFLSFLNHSTIGYSSKQNIVMMNKKRSAPVDTFIPFGGIKTSSVAVDSFRVYRIQKEPGFPAPRFTLISQDRASGKIVWYFSEICQCTQVGFCSSPIVMENILFAGWGNGHVFGFDPQNGDILWRDTLDSDVIGSPAITNNNLFFSTVNGSIYNYHLSALQVPETFETGTYYYPNPSRGAKGYLQVIANHDGIVNAVVYSMSEQPVLRFSKHMSTGEKYVYTWDLTRISNGAYIARIVFTGDNGKKIQKIVKIGILK